MPDPTLVDSEDLGRGIDPVLVLLDHIREHDNGDLVVVAAGQTLGLREIRGRWCDLPGGATGFWVSARMSEALPVCDQTAAVFRASLCTRGQRFAFQGPISRLHARLQHVRERIASTAMDGRASRGLAAARLDPRALRDLMVGAGPGGPPAPDAAPDERGGFMQAWVVAAAYADVRLAGTESRFWAVGTPGRYRCAFLRAGAGSAPAGGVVGRWARRLHWVYQAVILAGFVAGHLLWQGGALLALVALAAAYVLTQAVWNGAAWWAIRSRLGLLPSRNPAPRVVVCGPDAAVCRTWLSLVAHVASATGLSRADQGGPVLGDTRSDLAAALHDEAPAAPWSFTFCLRLSGHAAPAMERFIHMASEAHQGPGALQRRVLHNADQVWLVLPAEIGPASASEFATDWLQGVDAGKVTVVQDDPLAYPPVVDAGCHAGTGEHPAGRRLRVSIAALRHRYLTGQGDAGHNAHLVEWLLSKPGAVTAPAGPEPVAPPAAPPAGRDPLR